MKRLWLPLLLFPVWCCAQEQTAPGDNFEMVKRLHARAVKSAGDAKFENYRTPFETWTPDDKPVQLELEMVAIDGGTFLMGKNGGNEDEAPAHRVKVSPFWMGKYEVTWNFYEPFSITAVPRNHDGSPVKIPLGKGDDFLVSKPTVPYTKMDFGMGTTGYPAVNMTQHAASKFCQWLSAKTGHFYRLPTEAEWEYACRAGTTGPFSCPAEKIFDYAVCEPDFDNPQLDGYAKVGTRKPNPWGLFDMHGNVMEWCLDQYNPTTYASRRADGGPILDPLVRATRLYPRVARGGSWYDAPESCTSSTRFSSTKDLKLQDPQLPKSIWYHTDAHWLGFRVVRPREVPSPEEMDFYWNSAHPDRLVEEK